MNNIRFGRYWLYSCVAAAMLASCGGSQPPIAAPGAMPQSHATATHAVEDDSAIKSAAKGRSLLYITSGIEEVFVYTYPRLKFLGELGAFDGASSECADKAGDVFINTGDGLLEYAHGGAEPIHTLNIAGPCSRDAVTGNLAVTRGPQVLIYRYSAKRGWLFPHTHDLGFNAYFCGYDDAGDLFVDGENSSGEFEFAELKKGARNFAGIAINQTIASAGQVQWDGKHIAVGDSGVVPSVIYQFAITGSSAEEVGSTTLSTSQTVGQFWIQGGYVVGPEYYDGNVGLWRYPQGGSPIKTISSETSYGAAVSVAPR